MAHCTDIEDQRDTLKALRGAVARIEGHGASPTIGSISFCPAIDHALPTGGLARGAFYRVGDLGAAVGFTAFVLGRTAGPMIWIGTDPDRWPAGLQRFGLSAQNLILVGAKDGLSAFKKRCGRRASPAPLSC